MPAVPSKSAVLAVLLRQLCMRCFVFCKQDYMPSQQVCSTAHYCRCRMAQLCVALQRSSSTQHSMCRTAQQHTLSVTSTAQHSSILCVSPAQHSTAAYFVCHQTAAQAQRELCPSKHSAHLLSIRTYDATKNPVCKRF